MIIRDHLKINTILLTPNFWTVVHSSCLKYRESNVNILQTYNKFIYSVLISSCCFFIYTPFDIYGAYSITVQLTNLLVSYEYNKVLIQYETSNIST